jgi:hypothetical protein
MYTCTIKPSYRSLRSLYIGADARTDPKFVTGKVAVILAADAAFSVEGTMNSAGYLSGMAKLYKQLNLQDGTDVQYEFSSGGVITIHAPAAAQLPAQQPADQKESVFQAKRLKHIYIEPFRPENLNTWEPENETDVYLAFGVLQDYTDYQYCCAAS